MLTDPRNKNTTNSPAQSLKLQIRPTRAPSEKVVRLTITVLEAVEIVELEVKGRITSGIVTALPAKMKRLLLT